MKLEPSPVVSWGRETGRNHQCGSEVGVGGTKLSPTGPSATLQPHCPHSTKQPGSPKAPQNPCAQTQLSLRPSVGGFLPLPVCSSSSARPLASPG